MGLFKKLAKIVDGALEVVDDESMGMGGVLARYSAEGAHTFVLTATRPDALPEGFADRQGGHFGWAYRIGQQYRFSDDGEPGGKTAHAFYYPPANRDFRGPAGEAPPLLVMIHGGPTAQVRAAWDARSQFFATRDFELEDPTIVQAIRAEISRPAPI